MYTTSLGRVLSITHLFSSNPKFHRKIKLYLISSNGEAVESLNMVNKIAIVGTAKSAGGWEPVCPPLSDFFVEYNFELVEPSNADYFVSINHNPVAYKEFMARGGGISHTALIRVEPDVVFPGQYRFNVEKRYKYVVTPGAVNSNFRSDFSVNWPYSIHSNPAKPMGLGLSLFEYVTMPDFRNRFRIENWSKRKNKFVLIAANKVSPINASNYSVRRGYASKSNPQILDVYGVLWGDPLLKKIRHRAGVLKAAITSRIVPSFVAIYGDLFRKYVNFIGEAHDKHEVAQNYKYALVIENSHNYISEKVIDALMAGCIPLYIGADLKLSSIPSDLFLLPKFPEQSLEDYLDSLTTEQIKEKLHLTYEYLTSSKFIQEWSENLVYRSIGQYLLRSWDIS